MVQPDEEPASPPLSKIATASGDFGPVSSVAPPIEPQREPAREWFSPPRGGRREEPPITGPSFLGLSDPDGRSEADLSYLYEDDYQRPNRARQWLLVLLVIALIGAGYYEWRRDPAVFSKLNDWARHSIDYVRGIGGPHSSSPDQNAQADGEPPVSTSPLSGGVTATQESSKGGVATGVPERGGQESAAPGRSTAQARQVPETSTASPAPEKNQGQANAERESADAAEPAAPSQATSEERTEETAPGRATVDSKVPAAMAAPTVSAKHKTRVADAKPPGSDLVARADEYLYGRGVPRSCDQALVYLRAAADHGNNSALSKLGGLYATGNCVPLDRAQAYNWFSRALAGGDHNIWIQRNMSMLWNQMTPAEKSRIKR